MKRVCTNCAFCERFKYSQTDKKEMMRCWNEPGVCDHAFVISIAKAENYKCDNHKFKNERDKELFEEATYEYEDHKRAIKKLEGKYPKLLLGSSSEIPNDLEEAAEEHAGLNFDRQMEYKSFWNDVDTFKAGAEWREVQDQKTIELAEDHAMLAGMNKMEQQMMEKAVECVVENWNHEPHPEITIPLNPEVFGVGDKVRVIVIKED